MELAFEDDSISSDGGRDRLSPEERSGKTSSNSDRPFFDEGLDGSGCRDDLKLPSHTAIFGLFEEGTNGPPLLTPDIQGRRSRCLRRVDDKIRCR